MKICSDCGVEHQRMFSERCFPCDNCTNPYVSITIANDDPWRKAYLSCATSRALSEQNRPMDPLAPKDKFERKHIERATGRRYIGDDTSSLRPSVQTAIETYKDKKRQREVA